MYYRFNRAVWQQFEPLERERILDQAHGCVQQIAAAADTQLIWQQVVGHKADLAFMLLSPDFADVLRWQVQLGNLLGAGVLEPVYSYFSITEGSEYRTTREQYVAKALTPRGIEAGSEQYEQAMQEFEVHAKAYEKRRIYPQLPPWELMCFYPMSKRREAHANWYGLDYEQRHALMGPHADTGRRYAGRILQLITGSTGLDMFEWGVTLLAHKMDDIKSIVYTMRYDEVSSKYAEFGDFYIGQRKEFAELLGDMQIQA